MTLEKYEGPASLVIVETDPEQEILFQTKVAKALMDVIKKSPTGKFVTRIQNKDFLGFEAWQTIARMNKCNVIIESTEPIYDRDGEIISYDSWAKVVRSDGEVVSRANMECGMEAFPVQGKLGREKDKAAKSTSQTWAGAKACRMAFSFVAVLAGYEATTAEEMSAHGDSDEASDSSWLVTCPVDNIKWFKNGSMREPAHKLPSGEWCNQSRVLKPLINGLLKQIVADSWEKKDVDAFLKTNFGGTWSTLSPKVQLDAIEQLKTTPPPGSQAPETAPDPTPEQFDETIEGFDRAMAPPENDGPPPEGQGAMEGRGKGVAPPTEH